MRALELNSIMLTRLSWWTRTVNLLTHRHAITRTWVVMYPCTFKFNVWQLNTWLSDRNIHKRFFMKTLMHTNTSSKTTHSIKTPLIKQFYTWYACLNVLLILPQCADTVTLICMLYTTCSMFRAWPVYISLLYHAEIMQLLNHVLSKLNKSSI
jgi:hypothetical protein